jgi:hypothetical protein
MSLARLLIALDALVVRHPQVALVVLSEYTP